MREPIIFGSLQRVAQVRGLVCQHRDDLVEVAVGGDPGDAMIAGQCIGTGAVAEPPQAQYRLPKAGQRPAATRCAAPTALREQQLREELRQFPGHVERGIIGDHVEPSRGS